MSRSPAVKQYGGAATYLPDEKTPVESEAADYLIELSRHYTAEAPLYILAIGAITNVASALLKCPEMKERTVASGLAEILCTTVTPLSLT